MPASSMADFAGALQRVLNSQPGMGCLFADLTFMDQAQKTFALLVAVHLPERACFVPQEGTFLPSPCQWQTLHCMLHLQSCASWAWSS